MKLTESHLRNLIKQEIKTSLNEAYDATNYEQQLEQIYSDLYEKILSGEAEYQDFEKLRLPGTVLHQLQDAHQKRREKIVAKNRGY